MIIHEDFTRCPECNHPYFERDTSVVIDKLAFDHDQSIIVQKEITVYRCKSCTAVIGKTED